MHQNPTLARLHLDYTGLASEDPHRLNEDQARSLQYFEAERTCSLDGREPRERILRWVYTVQLVDVFAQAAGRLPRENNRLPKSDIDPFEQRLADWIRYQRRPATQSLHCDYQRRRLECLHGFSWDPLGEQWDSQLAKFAQFVEELRRVPRYRADDVDERNLAAWVTRQRHFLRLGLLPADRVSDLRKLGCGFGVHREGSTSRRPSEGR